MSRNVHFQLWQTPGKKSVLRSVSLSIRMGSILEVRIIKEVIYRLKAEEWVEVN